MSEVEHMKQTLTDLSERNEAVEELIREMARKQGIVTDGTSTDLSYV